MRARERAAGPGSTRFAVVLFAVAIVASGVVHGATAGPGSAPANAAQELALAARSLESGGGPAAGSPLACRTSGAADDACRSPSSASPAATPSYAWSNLSSQVSGGPSGRFTSMTWDAADGYVLLFGGSNPLLGSPFTDTWTYSNGTWANITTEVSGAPPALAGSSMAYDSVSGQVILFGGGMYFSHAFVVLNYTYAYHARVWTNLTGTTTATPAPRAYAALSMDTTDGELVLFGGKQNATLWLNDTWTFAGGTWASVTGGLASRMPSILAPLLADDPPGSGALLFGGAQTGTMGLDEVSVTFVFAHGAWTNVTSTAGTEPPAFYFGGAQFVPSFNADLVFGTLARSSSGLFIAGNSTWEYAGGAWTNVTSAVTPVGMYPDWLGASAYVPYGQAVLVFGGTGPIYASPYLWALAKTVAVTATVSSSTTDVGATLAFTGSATGGLPPVGTRWTFGDGTSASASVTTHAYAAVGTYEANFTATSLTGQSATESLLVLVESSVTVSIVYVPQSPTLGTEVGFAPSVAGGVGPYTYAWSFGDGATSTSIAPTHLYASTGDYTVRLNVTDSTGVVASALTTVTVRPASSLTAPPPSSTNGDQAAETWLAVGLIAAAAVAGILGAIVVRGRRPPGPAPRPDGPPAPR